MANTYHCLCTTLILITTHDLESSPRRKEPALDRAHIVALSEENSISRLYNVVEDENVVVKREDGFEQRQLIRCSGCNLIVGYKLDQAHYLEHSIDAARVAYLLPGGLTTTNDMEDGRLPETPDWTKQQI